MLLVSLWPAGQLSYRQNSFAEGGTPYVGHVTPNEDEYHNILCR